MPPPLAAGFLQTFTFPSPSSILIHDDIYGDHAITEPVLIDLLLSPDLLRLRGVYQHGITGLLGLTLPITRLEHSVGAFLLVRQVGASVEEQVAALLHDISHTTLSHVIDWAALCSSSDEDETGNKARVSFHEVHKQRFIQQQTQLPEILARHGFDDLKPLQEDLYPLVEMPSPHLCADRVDYGLRDAVGFGKMSLRDAQRVFRTLKAFPDDSCSYPQRLLVLDDAELALSLARAYMAIDREVWSNEAHIDMYQRTGRLIGDMIRRGDIKEDVLWKLSDRKFWALMRSVADPEGLDTMEQLEKEGLPKRNGLRLLQGAKVRTIDPDIWLKETGEVCPLSALNPEWAAERKGYIQSRQA